MRVVFYQMQTLALDKMRPPGLKPGLGVKALRGAEAVQFHDILYKTFRDILYTRPAGIAGGGAVIERGCTGSSSQIRVRR